MLEGKIIAVPESRELISLSRLLRNRGAKVREVPLIAILDAPDSRPVLDWIRRFIDQPPDLLILLTGEGLRRLMALAELNRLKPQFLSGLESVAILTRGPKPERVLRELGIKTSSQAVAPTTAGVIESLQTMSLRGQKVAVQLYAEEPNLPLQNALIAMHARLDAVAPYIYASQAQEQQVVEFIHELASGKIDALAFTSQPQLHRLLQVANTRQLQAELQAGMQKTVIAAVGPVVSEQLEKAGFKVSIMPKRVYFMKPLVMAIQRHFEALPKVPYNQAMHQANESGSGV